jgi:hypothetical protein
MQTKMGRSISSSTVAIMQNKYGGVHVLKKDTNKSKFAFTKALMTDCMREMGADFQFRNLFSRLPSTPAKIDTFENTICNYFAWV